MFKVNLSPTFPATVNIPAPGGAVHPLDCVFKWMSRDEFLAWCKTAAEKSDPEFFAPLIEAWDADVSCDPAGMQTLFNRWPRAGRALFDAFRAELLGAEEKN